LEEFGDDRYLWESSAATTGIENLTQLTVTVRLSDDSARSVEISVTTLAFEEPETTVAGGTP
jgi:hypothetical protein